MPALPLLPIHLLAPTLWLALYPLAHLLARASGAAYRAADAATREATGRELSRPFASEPDGEEPALSLGRWLGVAAFLFAACALSERLASDLGWSRFVDLFLRGCLGFFLFGNLLVLTQRARNAWFFRRIRREPRLLQGLQRQSPAVLYWNGLLISAAFLLLVAGIVAPSAWLWGGTAGLLRQAQRFAASAREAAANPEADDARS